MHMNDFLRILSVLTIFVFLVSCECEDCKENGNYKVKVTINYINETAGNVLSFEGCNKDISSGNTLTFLVEETVGSKPNINNFPVSIFTNCNMMYEDGSGLKCEDGINSIQNYEDRKEVEPLVFEFTFRFTEERKNKAEPCNL